jgi:hypothetical protein
MAITAPLGVNIPSAMDKDFVKTLNSESDWSFLDHSNIQLEVFGGNHILEATKSLLAEHVDSKWVNYFESRSCTIYYGLTTDEIHQVQLSF